MASPASFGDLIDAAREQITAAGDSRQPGGEDLLDITRGVRHVIVVLRRYAMDVATGFGMPPDKPNRPAPRWAQAAGDAQKALSWVAGHLFQLGVARGTSGTRATASAASKLDQAGALLQAGHELLDTHFGFRPDGRRVQRTELAAVLVSPGMRRALLEELGSLTRSAAECSGKLAAAPGWRGAPHLRRALRQAGEFLQTIEDTVQAGLAEEPVSEGQRDLLRSIPASILPPRRQPQRDLMVTELCAGVIACARRVRRAAWVAAKPADDVTIRSLRQVASAATVTSHHCELLLRAVAERAAGLFPDSQVSHDMVEAADVAGWARGSWLTTAQQLNHFTTAEPRADVSRTAEETADLAQWTGRLAYADPTWTLAKGPGHEVRSGASLAPTLADIPLVVAAVHYAADTLEAVAAAEQDQISTAARRDRLLVPIRSLPRADGTHPFSPAPPGRVADLTGLCQAAGQASADTATAMSGLAASVRSPSWVLTSVRDAIGTSDGHLRRWRVPAVAPYTGPGWSGPLETSMRDLGVTSPWLVQRAIALDRASADLILDAAAEADRSGPEAPAAVLRSSVTSAEIVDGILASRNPRAAALLQPRQSEPGQAPSGHAPSDHAPAGHPQPDDPEREP